MDIRAALLKEHSKANSLHIAAYIGTDEAKFAQLIELFLAKEYRVTQRAAWVMSFCTDQYPHLARPYFAMLWENLKPSDTHDAVKRNTLRYFAEQEIPEELQGLALDLTFKYLLSMQEKPAIKVHAMRIAYNICQVDSDLLRELAIAIEDQLPYGSTGFKNCGSKILIKIKKQLRT